MEYIFFNDPQKTLDSKKKPEIGIQVGSIEDMNRYAKHLFYNLGQRPNYDKIVKQALSEYLDNLLTKKDLKELESMKDRELEAIEEHKQKLRPNYDWDKNKQRKE